ncbi:hypothetical protein GQ53DRAFT_641318 [Thozetella sp. PMI_491]|nr:hypothetical protein GQ53DRAFT_641318 [Thozetella sp. PMI_491]
MLFALVLQLGTAILGKYRLRQIFEAEDISNGLLPPPPTFVDGIRDSLRSLLVAEIISKIELFGIKLNFLLFFRRLSADVSPYREIWWVVLVITVASGAVFITLNPYRCEVGEIAVIFSKCTGSAAVHTERIEILVTCILDVATDVMAMGFPIAVIWRVRVSTWKKLSLSALFGLSLATIVIAILRSVVNYQQITTAYRDSINLTWVWMWLSIECMVCVSPLRPLPTGCSL